MTGRTGGRAGPTEAFFEDLASTSHPLLKKACGTVRVDLHDRDGITHWFVTLDEGRASVSHRKGRADGTVHAERSNFDRIVTGEMNAMAAMLRGDLRAHGDLALVILMARLFPGPPGDQPIDLRERERRAEAAGVRTAEKELATTGRARR